MAVIKRQQAAALLKEAIVLDLGDIAQQAARIEAAARAQARQIEQAARDRAAQMTANASAEGFAQGRVDGLAAGRVEGRRQGREEALQQVAAQLEQVQQSWIEAASQWDAYCRTVQREARQDVLELALRLAEKIVHRAVQCDDTIVLDQVRCALTHALGDHDVTVRIAPGERPVLEAAMPKLMEQWTRFEHVKLVDDEAVRPGGCVVSFGQGQVDATLETQLRRAVELLLPEPQVPAAAASTPDETEVDAAVEHLDQSTSEAAETMAAPAEPAVEPPAGPTVDTAT